MKTLSSLPISLPLCPPRSAATKRTAPWLAGAFAAALLFFPALAGAITPGTRYPTNEEQYTLQLINRARVTADGLSILQGLVTNNLQSITASTTGESSDGTAWSAGFWTSGIPGVADSMNYFRVHPGDLKKQFLDLAPAGAPLAWHANLGNVAAGYNDLVIANQGAGPGFPHSLSPYENQSTFAAYAKRYVDGGYGPLNTINALGENIAPNFFSDALATFAGFMIDWGNTANGIQSQDPEFGSHRLSLMGSGFAEVGISRKLGWDSSAVTEVQEFGRRFSTVPAIVGAAYVDQDGNGFYTPGEGLGQLTVAATPVGGGSAIQTQTYSSGGYALEISTPGNYTVTFSDASGVIHTATVTMENQHVLLDAVVVSEVVVPPSRQASDLNGDDKPDYVLYYASTRRTAIWYLDGAAQIGAADGPTLTSGWVIAGVADFNADNHPDYLLYNSSNRRTQVWYLDGPAKIGSAAGPTLTSGWKVAGLEDFNRDGQVDYLLYHANTRQTMVWYLNGVTQISTASGPAIPTGAVIAGVADFNADSQPDILLFSATGRRTTVYYLDDATQIGEASGPTLARGWVVSGVADFNADGRADYLLFSSTGRRTEIRHLNGLTPISSASGPALASGWTLVSP